MKYFIFGEQSLPLQDWKSCSGSSFLGADLHKGLFCDHFNTHSCLVVFKVKVNDCGLFNVDGAKVLYAETCRQIFNTFSVDEILKNIKQFTLSKVSKYVNNAKNGHSSRDGENTPILFS